MLLNDEQQMIQDSLRAFAQEQLAPHADAWERGKAFPYQALRGLAELGVLGITVPIQWGGAGMDYRSLVLAIEEIAAGDPATSTIVSVHNSLACSIIQRAIWASGCCISPGGYGNPPGGRPTDGLACRRTTRCRPCLKEASMAKLFASEMVEQVSSDAIQIHGGYGYVTDFPVERIYRAARVTQIYEGVSDIQRLLISRTLLNA